MTSPEVQLENLRDRIEEADVSEDDRDALRAFDDALTLLNSNYSTYRHVKLLRHVLIIAERVGCVNAALTDKSAAENIVRWINRTYDNEETNQDYRVALKVFGRRVTDDGVGGATPTNRPLLSTGCHRVRRGTTTRHQSRGTCSTGTRTSSP